jgi:hypothetical protein
MKRATKNKFFNRSNMKTLGKLMMMSVAGLLILSCQKEDAKTVTNPASVSVTANATQTTLVLDSTGAKTTTATVISWNAAKFGAQIAVSYSIQYDTGTGNFTKPTSVALGNNILSQTFTVRQLNDLALELGMKTGVAGTLKVRIASDVGSPDVPVIYSPIVTLTVTPYTEQLPLKFPLPSSGTLFITGAATPGGWMAGGGVGVPVPSQQFTQIDYRSFGIIINLTGGQQFLVVPVNGDWSNKYATANASASGTGSSFAFNASNNFNAPATTGVYMIVFDFVTGAYTITPYSAPQPNNLFITGDATPGGWMAGGGVGVPVPSQQFTQLTNSEYTITLSLTGTGAYLFVPVNGDWTHKYATTNGTVTGGPFTYDGPNNFPGPTTAGTYTIDVNFLTGTYKVTQ